MLGVVTNWNAPLWFCVTNTVYLPPDWNFGEKLVTRTPV
jgi:hypothetical protein